MSGSDLLRHDEALDWVRRIHDPSFSDWDGHLAWLETDPRNAEAFEVATLLIEDATFNLRPLPPFKAERHAATNDNGAISARDRKLSLSRWSVALGGTLAAGFAAIIAVPVLMNGGAEIYRVDTAPGIAQQVTLKGGTTVAINGGSSVEFDRRDPRVATVVQGEALFHVVHDASHPFAVKAGGGLFQDVGTSFDVVRDAGGVRVAVREGAVMYDPKGAAVRLVGGQQVVINPIGATIGQVDAGTVGGWRQGRLSYSDATLSTVAADLSRSLGDPVRVDPLLQDRHFSGVIMVEKDRARMFRRIASVMDVAIRQNGSGWLISPRAP